MIPLFLVGPATTTLQVRISNYAEQFLDPTVAAVATLVIGFTVCAILLTERFSGIGRQFR